MATPVFFQDQTRQGFIPQRKAALERLLDREGSCLNYDLFDPACNKDATHFNISVTDEDFARYDREDSAWNKISLNEQQREAFTKLLELRSSVAFARTARNREDGIHRCISVHFSSKAECAKNCWSASLTKRSTRLPER